jgi:hypothetical protein
MNKVLCVLAAVVVLIGCGDKGKTRDADTAADSAVSTAETEFAVSSENTISSPADSISNQSNQPAPQANSANEIVCHKERIVIVG